MPEMQIIKRLHTLPEVFVMRLYTSLEVWAILPEVQTIRRLHALPDVQVIIIIKKVYNSEEPRSAGNKRVTHLIRGAATTVSPSCVNLRSSGRMDSIFCLTGMETPCPVCDVVIPCGNDVKLKFSVVLAGGFDLVGIKGFHAKFCTLRKLPVWSPS